MDIKGLFGLRAKQLAWLRSFSQELDSICLGQVGPLSRKVASKQVLNELMWHSLNEDKDENNFMG
jgi:hypothetical protein